MEYEHTGDVRPDLKPLVIALKNTELNLRLTGGPSTLIPKYDDVFILVAAGFSLRLHCINHAN
jgi:hypothetical protein